MNYNNEIIKFLLELDLSTDHSNISIVGYSTSVTRSIICVYYIKNNIIINEVFSKSHLLKEFKNYIISKEEGKEYYTYIIDNYMINSPLYNIHLTYVSRSFINGLCVHKDEKNSLIFDLKYNTFYIIDNSKIESMIRDYTPENLKIIDTL